MFKPFVFVKHSKELKETTSPSYGPDDPVKKKPRFQSKPDRKHELFVKHEVVAAIIETNKVRQVSPSICLQLSLCMVTAYRKRANE